MYAASVWAGILAPISSVWATKPFYDWAAHGGKRNTAEFNWLLAGSIERLTTVHLGTLVGVLLVAWWLARPYRLALQRIELPSRLAGLDWPDIVAGAIAFGAGLYLAVEQMTAPAEWVAYTLAAFLMCFAFRWQRLRNQAIEKALPDAMGKQAPVAAVVLALIGGGLLAGYWFWEIVVGEGDLPRTWKFILGFGAIPLSIPYLAWLCSLCPGLHTDRSAVVAAGCRVG